MSYMPTPDYGLLKNLPQPDPVGSALDAYQKVSANVRANKATALAQKLGSLQAQKAKIALANQQQDETLSQKTKQSALDVSHLQVHNAMRTIHDTRLADIHEMPAAQQEGAWQNFRHEMTSLGGDTSQIPAHFNDEAAAESKNAYNQSPLGTADRKFARDTATQQLKDTDQFHREMAVQALKNQGVRQAAQAKAAMKAPSEIAFQKEQGKQLVKDNATINTASNEAQTKAIPLWTEINKQLNKVITGPGIGHVNWRSADAQRLNQLIMQAQGLKIKSFHLGRMTQYEFNIIRKMVGTPTMYKKVLKKVVQKHLRDAQEAIEQQKFTAGYIKQGGRSPIEMSNQWVKEVGNRRQADLEFTAKQNKMTVEQVKKQMGY